MKTVIEQHLLLAVTFSAVAQNNTFDLRLVELRDQGYARTYHNFIYDRNIGKALFEIYHMRQPHVDYYETGVGVGYNIASIKGVAVYPIAHYLMAADDNYLLPGIFLLDVTGKVTGSVWLMYYIPFNDGIHQWLLDPGEIAYNVVGKLSVGVSTFYWRPEGGEALTKVGPKFSLADKYGATEVRVAHVNNGGGTEIQLRRLIIF